MIAPIHIAAGALAQRNIKRWYLWVPLAFFSHQVFDWTNGHLWHKFGGPYFATGEALPITVLAIIGVVALAWYGRRQWLGMLVATSPDLIDFLAKKLGHGTPIHSWFWSARWQQVEWAFIWLTLAVIVFVLILREEPNV